MPPQQQQQSGGGNNDNGLAPVWITAAGMLAVYVIWRVGHTQIVQFLFACLLLQAKAVNFFYRNPPLVKLVTFLQTTDPATVTWGQITVLYAQVGFYVRYPFAAVLFLVAIILYRSDITLHYRKQHSMQTLRLQEQRNWPAIAPVVKEDLVKADIQVGPWAMALNPMEFARKYALLKKNDMLMDNTMPGEEMTASIRRSDAKRVFTLQLGPCFNGFDRCTPQVRALAAVFMARMNRDRGAATHILETLDKTSSVGQPDYSVALPTLKKYCNTSLVQEILQRHAYVLTVLASLLEASRDDGVVPSAEFLWLKPVDRRLWYMLNCVGRQTPFAEIAGPFAHWRAEKAMQRRSLVPMIDEAIKALEIGVKEVKLTSKELQELNA